MELDFLGGWELPHFDLASLRVEGRLLLVLYVFLFVGILYARRDDFRPIRGRRLTLFLILLLVTIPLNNVLWLSFSNSNVLPPPAVPMVPPAPSVPLLGSVSILLVGALFGAGPAMVTGLVAGLVRGGLHSSRVLAPFELAIFGLVLGVLLQQTFQGRLWQWLRQPLVAGLVGSACHWVALWFGIYGATSGSALSALDYTQSLLFASLAAVFLGGLISGLVGQAAYAIVPGVRPSPGESRVAPHLRSMSRRLLSVLIPFIVVMGIVLMATVASGATGEATNQASTAQSVDKINMSLR